MYKHHKERLKVIDVAVQSLPINNVSDPEIPGVQQVETETITIHLDVTLEDMEDSNMEIDHAIDAHGSLQKRAVVSLYYS